MKTIVNDITSELEIKNSKFITLLIKIDDNSDINKILDEIRIKYPKATHYCYAFRTETREKASDDGEPGGTAGTPMLNVLQKEEITGVLAVIVRYFGGIKLGAGGLVRAYTKSMTDAIKASEMINLEKGYLIKITTNYSNQKQLDYVLRNFKVVDKSYDLDITYLVEIAKDKLDVVDEYEYEIVTEKLIEVF